MILGSVKRIGFLLLLLSATAAVAQPVPQETEGSSARGAVGRSIYLGGGLVNELSNRFPARLFIAAAIPGSDLGVRFTVDAARQSPAEAATLAVMAHLLFLMEGDVLRGYLGLGVGWQVDPFAWPQANDGFLGGALLGISYRIDDRWGGFVEVGVDYYPGAPPDLVGPYRYDHLYPTIVTGLTFRLR